MFGAVCSGRPVVVATQVDTAKFQISVPQAAGLSHVAVFLLPDQVVPPDYGCLVYFRLPHHGENDFQLLGGLDASKPLAIFRFNSAGTSGEDELMDADAGALTIGISIEPASTCAVMLQLVARPRALPAGSAPAAPLDVAVLANKIVQNAYNYLGLFTDAAGKVPMAQFDLWWNKFRAKLQNNPKFLDNQV